MNKFIHLVVKSQYSLLESCITVKALVEKAKSLNMEYAALTDTSVLAKNPEFVRACREADIKPLIGCEFSVFHYQLTYNLVLIKVLIISFGKLYRKKSILLYSIILQRNYTKLAMIVYNGSNRNDTY